MIIPKTKLVVADNSGAKFAVCISTLASGKYPTVGCVIVVSVQQCRSKATVKSGDVYLALIVRSKSSFVNRFGFRVSYGDNAVVLLDKDRKMVGTRVFGPVSSVLKNYKEYNDIVSLACEVI